MKKVVVIGGGTGLATLLRGLRDYPIDISAIVTMTDDGASSGRLRKDFDMLPPGDIRNCIAALSENETSLIDLFQYRFKNGLGLRGHSLGNLLITAMGEMTGSFERAIEEVSRLLRIKGRVLPATLEDVNLIAKFTDGKEIVGESKITKYGYQQKIEKIRLSKNAKTNPAAIEAILKADLIIIGPGSFYTSVITNFLQKELLKAADSSKAFKLYVCNVSTERGETSNFSVSDHLKELEAYGIFVDGVLVNNLLFSSGSGDGFVSPVECDTDNIEGKMVILADVVNEKNPLYHDSDKLAEIIWSFLSDPRKFTKPRKSGNIIEL